LREKNGKKNRRKKVRENVLYSQDIRDQKMGGKKREIIFPETHEKCEQIWWEKIVGKKCEKTFFIFKRIL